LPDVTGQRALALTALSIDRLSLSAASMQELINQVATLLRGMWQYRRLGVLVAWIVTAVVAAAIMTMPNRFEASARVFVDTQTILRPLMSGLAVQPNIEQQINMLSRTLINRPNVEKLIRMADLDLAVKTDAERAALIEETIRAVSIQAVGQTNLYNLAYRGDSPEKALRVVQSLLTIFVESSLGDTKSDSEGARRFIQEQIKNYEAKLTEAESRLKDFRLRNIELQGQGGLDTASRMAELTSTLSQARLELREAESASATARRQLEQARAELRNPSRAAAPSIATPLLDARIEPVRLSLDVLLQRYTEQHPDVINARRLLKELEEQKRQATAELQRQALANPDTNQSLVTTNPAILELSRVAAAAEVQASGLRARVSEFESRMVQAQAQLKLAPQMEAEQSQLNRDYEVHSKNYNDLVKRRESITLSGELDNSSSLADFRVIDPPRANPKPVAPNRLLLMPLALLAALAGGLGITFLMTQVRPVFFDSATLRSAAELPILGVVSAVRNDALQRRERLSLKRFLAAVLALLVVFGAGMALMYYRASLVG
jgi:polysaccharide chain length determinant protein (PEP-CTERM system associated)